VTLIAGIVYPSAHVPPLQLTVGAGPATATTAALPSTRSYAVTVPRDGACSIAIETVVLAVALLRMTRSSAVASVECAKA